MRFNILSVCFGFVMMAALVIAERHLGTVSAYNPDTGIGMITPADVEGRKVKIAATSFRDPNLKMNLKKGDKVDYDLVPNRGARIRKMKDGKVVYERVPNRGSRLRTAADLFKF